MPRRTWRKLRPRWSLSVEQLEEKLPLAFGDFLGTLDGPSTATQALAEAAYSLAADGDLIVVGTPRADINGTIDAGSVDVRDRGTGDLIRTISNPTPAANDRFGFSVDISGDRLVVGTYQDDAAGVDAGAVYVFDLTSGALLHTLFNPSPAAFDQFGFDVAISGDLILVGAPLANNFAVEAGAAFVFDATTGSLLHALANPDGPSVTYFGSAVDISGNAVAVGAYRNDTGASDAGSVFLYDATTGGLQRQLANPTPAAAEYFGFSLAISGDDLVVVLIGTWRVPSAPVPPCYTTSPRGNCDTRWSIPVRQWVTTSDLPWTLRPAQWSSVRIAMTRVPSTPGRRTSTIPRPVHSCVNFPTRPPRTLTISGPRSRSPVRTR